MNWNKRLVDYSFQTAIDMKAWIIIAPEFRIDFFYLINKLGYKRSINSNPIRKHTDIIFYDIFSEKDTIHFVLKRMCQRTFNLMLMLK